MKNDILYDKNSTDEALDISCNVCPRKCNANRKEGTSYCKSKGLRIARLGLHMWEEPCISGKYGSGTIFFSGCSLRCIYCQNYDVSQKSKGYNISVNRLVEIFKELEAMGAHNINLVTPTHYIDYIIMALDIYKPHIPVCYNTSGYESEQSIKRLAGYVDIFLVDFKYIKDNLAQEFSSASDYPEVAQKAILQMKSIIPCDKFDSNGMMRQGVIVRHLVLPNCLQNTKEILAWVEKNLGKNTILSLMNQYTPYGKAIGNKIIGRKLKALEYKIAVNYALKLGLENAYVQDSESADECFIPEFFGEIME